MKKEKKVKRVICPYCGANAVLREDKYVHVPGRKASGFMYVQIILNAMHM